MLTHGAAHVPPGAGVASRVVSVHVVVVDDETRLVELITRYLEEVGFVTTRCHNGTQALEAAHELDPDVMVLDLMLPGMSGTEVCRTLRREGFDLPILMLTARGAVSERVAGLEAGADDYLVKPFAMEELAARCKALGRRRDAGEVRLHVGDVVLDESQARVWVAGIETPLTRREFQVLAELMRQPGRVLSRQHLFEVLWEGEVDIRSNAMEVHISRVRAHLQASDEVSITTLRGRGYRLDVAVSQP
jgi:two-component system, OmpR family, response regulator